MEIVNVLRRAIQFPPHKNPKQSTHTHVGRNWIYEVWVELNDKYIWRLIMNEFSTFRFATWKFTKKNCKLFWKIISLSKSSLINATDLDNCKADDHFHKEKITSSDDVASYDKVLRRWRCWFKNHTLSCQPCLSLFRRLDLWQIGVITMWGHHKSYTSLPNRSCVCPPPFKNLLIFI